MNKNVSIFLKVVLVVLLLFNLPYPKVYSEGINDDYREEEGIVQTVKKSKGKSIYIYNTHQGEKYVQESVIEGSQYLMKLLESKGYDVVYETNDFEKYKKEYGISYNQSYTVSKMYTQQAIKEHGHFDLYIDYHRDSVKKNLTSLSYKNKSYAKLMFVVGKSSSHYPNTRTEAKKLSEALNKKIPEISRGVYEKQSHYNQSVDKNMFLIEVGAHENTYTEVKNSLVILASVIDEYLS